MGLNKLVEAALIAVLLAAAVGQLPRLNQAIRVAQIQLLKDSQSSKWGRVLLLPASEKATRQSSPKKRAECRSARRP